MLGISCVIFVDVWAGGLEGDIKVVLFRIVVTLLPR